MAVEGEPFPTDQRNGAQRTAYTPEEQTALIDLIIHFDIPDNIVVQVFERCNRDAATTRQVLNGL
jgi:dUTPase